MPEKLKTCVRCGKEKPARHPVFDRHYGRADLLSNICADCRRQRNRERHAQNPEKHRAYRRQYDRQNPHITQAATRRWIEKNPERMTLLRQSYSKIQTARRSSKLTPPAACTNCGDTRGKVVAAVGDHGHPVETVRWLCRPCMRAWTPEQRAIYARPLIDPNYAKGR